MPDSFSNSEANILNSFFKNTILSTLPMTWQGLTSNNKKGVNHTHNYILFSKAYTDPKFEC